MSVRDLNRRLEKLKAAVSPEADAEAEQSKRIFLAVMLRRHARWLKLPVPEETAFLDALSPQQIRRGMEWERPGSQDGFAERLAAALERAEARVKAGVMPDPRREFESRVEQLRALNNAASRRPGP
jgi:hypothetical protein